MSKIFNSFNQLSVLKNDKSSFQLLDFLFWLILAVAFPLAGNNFTVFNVIHIVIYLCAVHFVAETLLHRLEAFRVLPFLIRSGIFILLGGLFCGLVFLVFYTPLFFYALFILFVIDLVKNKRCSLHIDWKGMLCLLPFLLMLFQQMELVYGTTERYTYWDGDYYFYTALTESLKTNRSVNDAIFHSGLRINYAMAPFLAPASLARFAEIPSQFALWGVIGKLLPVICFGSIGYFTVTLSRQLSNFSLKRNGFFTRQLLASFLLLFFGPLHFLKLKELDFKHVLFLGEGYVLPIGSPGFSLGMFIAGLIIYLVLQTDRWSALLKTMVVFLIAVLVATKLAMLLPLLAFLGVLGLLQLYKKNYQLFFVLLIALPFVAGVYLLSSASSDAMITTVLTTDGFYKSHYAALAEKYHINGSTFKRVLIMFSLSVIMWLSIKLVILVTAFKVFYKSNRTFAYVIISAITAFVVSCLPGFFLDSYGADQSGKFLFDAGFDMAQFPRASIFIISIISSIFLLYFIFEHPSARVRKFSLIIFLSWSALLFLSFFTDSYGRPGTMEHPWYREVKRDYVQHKPTLMAMLGSPDFSGQAIANLGVHPWYCTGTRQDGGVHLMSKKAHERNMYFRQLFDTTLSLPLRKEVAKNLKNENVDCLVATPHSELRFAYAIRDSLIQKLPGTKWMYRFN